MTITREERQRIVNGSEETADSQQTFQRSGVASSLMGMLAGLGMLVLLSALLGAGAILLDLEYGLISTNGDLQELSVIGLTITALVILAATLVGGYVAGRIARYGGMVVGLASTLWLTLVFAIFAGLALWIAAVSERFDGFDLAGEISAFATAELTTAAAIAGGGLFVLALLGGLLGGRFGQTEQKHETETVVDLRDVDESAETEREDNRASL